MKNPDSISGNYINKHVRPGCCQSLDDMPGCHTQLQAQPPAHDGNNMESHASPCLHAYIQRHEEQSHKEP